MNRRDFLKSGAASALGFSAVSQSFTASVSGKEISSMPSATSQSTVPFWPDGARLVVSISLQFEAGAQAERGAESPYPVIDTRYPDLPVAKWYEYGFKEGIPRLLDMFDRQRVKVTSHMVGAAVEKNPQLAKEIVERGHEASGHGQTWTPQYAMTPEEERASYEASITTIERATGTRPVGFNAFWMRATPHTLEILQDLGFLYHIDDVSRDEPFLVPVRNKPFVVVPYTVHCNDIVNYEGRHWSANEFATELKYEFDQLYDEAASRRRMMSVSAHDRVTGHAARTKALEEFIIYAQKHPGVVFIRKDQIARFALESPITHRRAADAGKRQGHAHSGWQGSQGSCRPTRGLTRRQVPLLPALLRAALPDRDSLPR
jgi:peptidoglycan/xylan/chitin deacetylase (PgdA/CDA1 family)